jgi:serine phosphatase RsbU (regulator of sigma subunit)
MDATVRSLDNENFFVTALVARWHAAAAQLTWVNCGNPAAYLVDEAGELSELLSPDHPPLGMGDQHRRFEFSQRQIRPGERLILVTDGVTSRRTEDGGIFGVDGLRRALNDVEHPTAAGTVIALQRAVTSSWREPLEDDATIVVLRMD